MMGDHLIQADDKAPQHLPPGWCRWLTGLALAGVCSCAAADPISVTVVLSERSEIYQAFFTSLQNKLSGAKFKLTSADAQDPIPGAGMVVVVGARAANALPPATNVPVLYALVPKSRYEALAKTRMQTGANSGQSAIYLEQPVERQLRLLTAALPGHHRVGILSSASSRDDVEQIRRAAPRQNLTVHAAEVTDPAGLSGALSKVMDGSDLLLALPDNTIYNSNTIRNLLFSSYRSGKPLVGFSAGLVKAGAIAAVYSTPEQFGEQAAGMLEQFSRSGSLPPAQYSQLFDVSVNQVVASSMGLALKDARAIEQELEEHEKAAP